MIGSPVGTTVITITPSGAPGVGVLVTPGSLRFRLCLRLPASPEASPGRDAETSRSGHPGLRTKAAPRPERPGGGEDLGNGEAVRSERSGDTAGAWQQGALPPHGTG